MTQRSPGTIQRIFAEKQYGFLRLPDGQEAFFHRSGCPDFDLLNQGAEVTCEVQVSPKGLRAEAVKLVE
jgi:cold shock CspA family protein